MDPKSAKSASKHQVSDVAPLPGQTAIPGTEPAPVLPVLTKDEKKQLGDAFLAALKTKEDAEAALAAARTKSGVAAAAIVKAFGHKGPFTIGGRLFTASKSKGEEGGCTMREVSGSKETL